MHLIPDSMDFSKYLQEPQEAARIKPASSWRDAVVDSFYGEGKKGAYFPWSKTHGNLHIRPGELSIWSGYNYSGKSLLLNQVMLGLMAQGEKVCIASFEMKPEKTLDRMSVQASTTRRPAIDFIDKFMKWTDGKLWIYDQTGVTNPKQVLAVARYCSQELGITHIVIDSLMKCGIKTDDYTAQSRFVAELCAHAMDTGMHVHLVAHLKKSESASNQMDRYGVKGAGEIIDQADNIYILWRNTKKEEEADQVNQDKKVMSLPDAILTCDKNRHGNWDGKIKLWYDPDSMQFTGYENARAIDFIDNFEAAFARQA